ncbi:MAG: ribbon-helix-helix domain-containing protein [Rhodospirillales bacterium]|nr:MAG: ribbon-helix-helix domain-containing protein [Rhodospirillales bacterium]
MGDVMQSSFVRSNVTEERTLNSEAKSTLLSRNITVAGRRTSVRLEPEMWMALKEISKREKCTMHDICSLINARKNQNTSLTAAIRVFLMLYFRASSTEDGHSRAGHGDFEHMKIRAKIMIKPAANAMGQGGKNIDYERIQLETNKIPDEDSRHMERAL